MMDKRLLNVVPDSKKYIMRNVLYQWGALAANIVMMWNITALLASLLVPEPVNKVWAVIWIVLAVIVRYVCAISSSRMSYLSSKAVKKTLREKIYQKLLRLGVSYKEQVKTSEIVQVAVEGVDQLETYFGAYLPQFFYAMIAPLTLFVVLCFVNVPSAIVLLVCVPMIPIAIAVVQTWAKKLLSKYWDQYTALGDTFLENLQGLTTLKIYQSDAYKNEQMNIESEKFRKITMKVLTMQLNSITIMDLVAYGGAALGMIMAVTQYRDYHVSLQGCLLIIVLSADFFIPMRQLGSFFHIAMNGMAASDKIFKLLDMPEQNQGEQEIGEDCTIVCSELSFGYEEDKEILHNISMSFPKGSFTAIVGESGSGKSTIAGIQTGHNRQYRGSVTIGGISLPEIKEASLMKNVTYVSHNSYLFKGTVRDNLLMGNPQASDEELWKALEQVKLADFLRNEKGLDTELTEKASNLSGGQCQRLAFARALLHDSPVYIFDEATSNIDVESENDIMKEIYRLAAEKTVILISHRLANVVHADNIYVLEQGELKESGTHEVLLNNHSTYEQLWNVQQKLENFGKEVQD
ncbi:MAG TPA: cysteine ABC transporter ATP-binding protein [Lachnospiraceae bacterium]|nr:cysteine ABC transporter ATP-binding protein [Lachnospiraceae bacterium]